jgi:hypothetical protein
MHIKENVRTKKFMVFGAKRLLLHIYVFSRFEPFYTPSHVFKMTKHTVL